MADLTRIDHLVTGDVVVHSSGKILFEVAAVHGWTGAESGNRGYELTVRLPDGTDTRRRWGDPDSVWVTVAGGFADESTGSP